MKKQIEFLKSGVLTLAFGSASLLIALTLTLSACNDSKPKDTKEVAEDHNEAKFENAKEEDAEFLVDAAEMNLEEIQLGQLAQRNGMNEEVKTLGKMMETEHTKTLDELKALAAKKQVTIPTTLTDDGMSANKKLMDMKASNFDKEYSDKMVNAHKEAISKFEKASTDAKDADIRNWATATLPGLRKHLDHSLTAQKQAEKNN